MVLLTLPPTLELYRYLYCVEMGQLLSNLNPWQPESDASPRQTKVNTEPNKNLYADRAKRISSAMDFEMCCIEMVIDGKFYPSRMEVWYDFVKAVRRHIPASKREKIDSIVKRWFLLFLSELPAQKDRIHEMQLEWESMM